MQEQLVLPSWVEITPLPIELVLSSSFYITIIWRKPYSRFIFPSILEPGNSPWVPKPGSFGCFLCMCVCGGGALDLSICSNSRVWCAIWGSGRFRCMASHNLVKVHKRDHFCKQLAISIPPNLKTTYPHNRWKIASNICLHSEKKYPLHNNYFWNDATCNIFFFLSIIVFLSIALWEDKTGQDRIQSH